MQRTCTAPSPVTRPRWPSAAGNQSLPHIARPLSIAASVALVGEAGDALHSQTVGEFSRLASHQAR